MSVKKYPLLELEDSRKYHLIPEEEAIALLEQRLEPNVIQIRLDDVPTLGQLILIFRTSKKLSQEQLAGHLGRKKRQIVNLERGACVPQFRTLEKLCIFFGSEFEEKLPSELLLVLEKNRKAAA